MWDPHGDNTTFLEDEDTDKLVQFLGEIKGSTELLFPDQSFESSRCSAVAIENLKNMHKHFPNLMSLSLTNNKNVTSLTMINTFTTLTSLDCPNCFNLRGNLNIHIRGRARDDGEEAQGLKNLEMVNFSGCRMLQGTLEAFRFCSKLQHLNLDGCQALKGSLDPVASMMSLRALSLHNCGLSGTLDALKYRTGLESLDLQGS